MSFQQEALEAHNEYREKHGVPPLKLSKKLTESAEKYAKELSKMMQLKHSQKPDMGENLASVKGGDLNGKAVTECWYNEGQSYSYEEPEKSNTTGNFTQILWLDTRKFGIAKAQSKEGTIYIVARYYPAGNFSGYFSQNVFKESSEIMERSDNRLLTAASIPEPKDFKKFVTKHVNKCRVAHGVSALKWDDKLASHAVKAAKELLDAQKSPAAIPADAQNYGTIVLLSSGGMPSVKELCRKWYDTSCTYDYTVGEYTQETGPFTQIVWSETKTFGVGYANNEKEFIFVGLFDPPGNVRGMFTENVKALAPGMEKPF